MTVCGATPVNQQVPPTCRGLGATASVISLLGHKEGDIAKQVAEKLASGLNATVVVTAGMHWPNISEGGILKVIKNSKKLTRMILEKTAKTVRSPLHKALEPKC